MATGLKAFLIFVLAILLAAGMWGFGLADGKADPPRDQKSLQEWAVEAVAEKPEVAAPAIAALREAGPAGLEALFEVHGEQSVKIALLNAHPDSMHEVRRLASALDAVARQKDAYASRLYWYTELPKAQAAARAGGKPILSLRLLGNLDEDCSCANSRFFRTVLYANAGLSKILRERFVLHWKTVRPVPKVSVDFGDGRTLVRTVTGNSIHYVLDSDGIPLDAIPGLYGPRAFLNALERAEALAKACALRPATERNASLRRHHEERALAVHAAWAQDLSQLGIPMPPGETGSARVPAKAPGAPPTAREALPIALAKGMIELPLVGAIAHAGKPLEAVRSAAVEALPWAAGKGRVERPLLNAIVYARQPLEAATNEDAWSRIAALHAADAGLDAGSKALLRAKHPTAFDASQIAMTKIRVEDPLLRLVRVFERTIAEDTVRNEYLLHRKIHEWFAAGAVGTDPVALNEDVYAELFLTPSSDPWLGLVPADTYSALENDGVRTARKEGK